MKILKIELTDLGLQVELEEYPHAQPVFPIETTDKELPALLEAWKINQDEVDQINEDAKNEVVEKPVLSAELKALEGKDTIDLVISKE